MEFFSAHLAHNVTIGNIFTFNSITPTPTTNTTRVVVIPNPPPPPPPRPCPASDLSRYENQKRRDWNTFCQYLNNHRPPLSPSLSNASHIFEFLKFLDQFGKTKVHFQNCPFFGMPNPPAPCNCPLRQAWGSLDALIGRLRAAFEEHVGGGKNSEANNNPFGSRSIRILLRDVRDFQTKSRGISYQKKRKRPSSSSNNKQCNIAIIRTTDKSN
ncbi:hypothetical protein Leryth_008673 [Lithospermum erythrorhizon]|uniref:ALOG domain-containing protein n=1 Tax=Lithospermum erythrorhizon TaxID=34254 RepID=A0AAV3PIL2_LITER|nr:hypothetical protein Leryth_008673 [Lithospermum erythrorhizon]